MDRKAVEMLLSVFEPDLYETIREIILDREPHFIQAFETDNGPGGITWEVQYEHEWVATVKNRAWAERIGATRFKTLAEWEAEQAAELVLQAQAAAMEHRPPPVGTRVRLRRPVERFPHFIASTGMVGTVITSGDELVYVKMDETLDGAKDWDNCVAWSDDDVSAFWGDAEVLDERKEA